MKKLLALLAVLMLAGGAVMAKPDKSLDVLPLMSSKSIQQNRVWVGTFQLVWNDFMDGIVKGPINFEDYRSPLAFKLNKQRFKADQLSEDSYYKTYGETSPELKAQIEKAIQEKFNETSDILDSIDWTPGPGKYLVYAMLKKDFKFLTAFDKLKPARFAHSFKKVDYFGIDENSDKILDDTLHVLFYNSSKDFAVSVYTQGNDILYLYRTDDDKTFDKLYSDMFMKKVQYDGPSEFLAKDEFKVPNISLYAQKSFDELCNHKIKGTDLTIGQALETVDFKMDNEGVKLKSEAAIATKMSMPIIPEDIKPRKFYFDDTFVLFLQESGKIKPYFALRVDDVSLINGTAKK